jgi:tyrosine-protein kinase Etk/Wzc
MIKSNDNLLIAPDEEKSANLKKRFFRMLGLWPWFLLSLLVLLSSAYLYLRYAQPVYQAIASIMVKDEKKAGDLSYNSDLERIGLGASRKLVENEVEVLRSYDLLETVVDTLQLFVAVKNAGRIKDFAVFGSEIPFNFQIVNPTAVKETKQWKITDTLNGLLLQTEKGKQAILLHYGTTYNTGGISYRFTPNSSYQPPIAENGKLYSNVYKISIEVPEETVRWYSEKLAVEPASKLATVINLEIEDNNRKRAAEILRTLISIYNTQALTNKNIVMDRTINFLNERLLVVGSELRGVEGTVERFKRENTMTQLSADAEQYLEVSKEVDQKKAENQTQINIINALETDLLQNQDNPGVVPTTFGIQDPSLNILIEKHNELVLQKERVQQKSGPKNPLLIDLQNQIKELHRRLITSVANLKQAYTISLNDISRKDAQMTNKIKNVPQLEKKLLQITRNQNVQEQLYSFLLQKREEASVARLSNSENSDVIVSARALVEVAPKRQIIWLLALLVGVMLPIGVISLKDFLDNKVGDIKQVQQKTSLPLIGGISHVRKLKSPFVVNSRSRSIVAEQIRNLRAALSHSLNGDGVKTVLVSSYQLGDGKSFVTVNLAAGYALLNKKTIILEFDLRRPRISTSLGVDANNGISSILNGEASYADLLVEIPGYNNNLFFLPAGTLPPNPADLISGSETAYLLKELQEHFDHIIIDSPPFSYIADTALLQPYADVTLIVLRQDYTSREVYSELDQWVSGHPGSPTYLLLNDVGKRRRYRANGAGYSKKYCSENNRLGMETKKLIKG